MTIRLPHMTDVRGVVIQSRIDHPQYVTKFRVQGSLDGTTFFYVPGEFAGNSIGRSNVKVRVLFPTDFIAQHVRFWF